MKRWVGLGRLKRRLMVYVILAIAPLVILNTLSQNAAWRSRRDAILSDSMNVAVGTATGVESYLSNVEALERAAAAALTANVVSSNKATYYLKRLRAADPLLLSIVVANPAGKIIYAEPHDYIYRDVSGERWFKDILAGKQEVVGDLFLLPRVGSKAFTVSVGARESGRLKFALSAVIDANALLEGISAAGVSQMYVAIEDSRGCVAATNDPALLAKQGLVDRSYVPCVKDALKGRRSVLTDWRDPADGDVEMGAASPVTRIGWAVSVLQPQDVAYKPIADARKRDLLTLFSFASVSLLLAWFFGNRISGAVEKLEDSAARLAAGDLSARSDIRRNDEIGRLAASFNQMGVNLEALHNAARSIGYAQDARSSLILVTREISKVARFDLCGFGIVDEISNEIEIIALRESDLATELSFRIPKGQGACGIAVAEKRAVSGPIEEFDDDMCRQLLASEGVRWAVAVPVVQGEEAVAVLAACSRSEGGIPERDIHLLSTMASLAAAGARNAAIRQRERRIAETLQRSFLPDIPPGIGKFEVSHLYHPALKEAEVGGDFYDFFTIDEKHSGVVIGDVAGKGLSAAVDAIMSKYMLRAYVFEDHKPTAVLSRLNDSLAAAVPSSLFITMVYGVLDLDKQTFTFSCAGHEPPILYKSRENEAIFLRSSGRALAVEAGEQYEAVEVNLEPGDCLLLYTDGISEARRNGEMFRDAGLQRAVVTCWSSGDGWETLNALFEQVLEYTDRVIQDDIAMLAIRRFA